MISWYDAKHAAAEHSQLAASCAGHRVLLLMIKFVKGAGHVGQQQAGL
jgi:hypothetical protein